MSKAEPWPNVPLGKQGQGPNPRSSFKAFTEKRPSFVVGCDGSLRVCESARLRVCESHAMPSLAEIKLTLLLITDEMGAAEDHPRDAKTGLQVTQAQETGAAAGRPRERD